MPTLRLFPILPLLVLPSLLGCSDPQAPSAPPPPSAASLKAVSENPGISRDRLAQAIDGLFDGNAVGRTQALIVLHAGETAAERYGEGLGSGTRLHGWGMSQCLTGIMIGLLVSDGRLRLDETAPVPAWQRSGDPRGEITLRQLLQMRSGLRHSETGKAEYKTDRMQMLFLSGRDNMAAYAEAQPLEAEPGMKFKYSSGNAVILADIATRALTGSEDPDVRRDAVSAYLRARLLEPAGMNSIVPEYDRAGTMIGAAMVHGTPRDWAKLGEFIRHGGAVRGAQVIPRRWIAFMRKPSPRNPGYGALLWLNHEQPDGDDVLFAGKAPTSLFACMGGQGHYVIGSPQQRLTVVRLGRSDEKQQAELRDRLGKLVALFPES